MKKSVTHHSKLTSGTDRRGVARAAAPSRRKAERIRGSWAAQVRGTDATGARFTETAVVEDVSAGGLFVRLGRAVAPGTVLFVVFTFTASLSAPEQAHSVPAPKVAARADVRRVVALDEGAVHGIGVEFRHHRFL